MVNSIAPYTQEVISVRERVHKTCANWLGVSNHQVVSINQDTTMPPKYKRAAFYLTVVLPLIAGVGLLLSRPRSAKITPSSLTLPVCRPFISERRSSVLETIWESSAPPVTEIEIPKNKLLIEGYAFSQEGVKNAFSLEDVSKIECAVKVVPLVLRVIKDIELERTQCLRCSDQSVARGGFLKMSREQITQLLPNLDPLLFELAYEWLAAYYDAPNSEKISLQLQSTTSSSVMPRLSVDLLNLFLTLTFPTND